MKSFFVRVSFILFALLIPMFSLSMSSLYALGDDENGIYAGAGKNPEAIRSGDFTMDDIPKIITGIIEILLGLAGTISIVALIYHALQMQLASGITGDSSGVDKAKAGMKGALLGFALSLSAWFLITKFVELLTSVT